MAVELRNTATIQTELQNTKLTASDDCHLLLARPLLGLKLRSFHAASTKSAEEAEVCTITEEHWSSTSILLYAGELIFNPNLYSSLFPSVYLSARRAPKDGVSRKIKSGSIPFPNEDS